MLIQLHKQDVYDSSITEFVAQGEYSETGLKTIDEVSDWIRSQQAKHSLSDRQTWLICTEDYHLFRKPEGTLNNDAR